MRALLIRTGSSPIHSSSSLIHNSPRVSMSYHDSVTGILFPGKNNMNSSTKSNSLHLESKDYYKNKNVSSKRCISTIRRAYSETDMFKTFNNGSELSSGVGFSSFPERIPEENEEILDDEENDEVLVGVKSSNSKNLDRDVNNNGIWLESEVVPEGFDQVNSVIDDLSDDQIKISDYYLEMLKSDPGNSLLLRNYGRFLHEVERDVVKAEEYYSRAILANPSGDGEVLCLYGKLIWESQKDRSRAKSYFERAVQVAPHDCFVMGSYAHFLWEAEEDDEEEEEEANKIKTSTSAMVEAF